MSMGQFWNLCAALDVFIAVLGRCADDFYVNGSDVSQYMLNALYEEAKSQGLASNVWQRHLE